MVINTALIFAAGFGTRMRPLTLQTPKPLLPIADKPILYHTLDMVCLNTDITTIFVNCHHLAPKIIDAIKHYPIPRTNLDIITLYEEEILDTGGTVSQLSSQLNSSEIITINGDVLFTHENYTTKLTQAFDTHKMDFLMLLQPCATAIGYQGNGEFNIDLQTQQLVHHNNQPHDYMFTGMQILKPQVIAAHHKKIFSLRDVFYPAAQNGTAYGLINDKSWYHISTPQDLENTNKLYVQSTL